MSEADFTAVITRAITDEDFRELLMTNSERAVKDYDLTEEEMTNLNGIDAELFDDPEALEERISRWGSGMGGGI